MKKYKPKTWFIYARLIVVFVIIFAVGRATNVVYDVIRATNENENKALDVAIIEYNKEDIYREENSVLAKYTNLPEKGFLVTNNNKKYELSNEEYNLLVAVVSSESNKTRDDILAVMSVILNRCDGSNQTPTQIITARGQFSGYLKGYYLRYLNADGSLTDNTNVVKEVVNDSLNGIRNNNYYSFRSWNTYSYSENYISVYGNRFK